MTRSGTLPGDARREATRLPGLHRPRLFAALLGLLGSAGLLAAPHPTAACAPATPTLTEQTAVGPSPLPAAPDSACTSAPPGRPGTRPGDAQLPSVAADPDQPAVAATASTLTGSTVTMTGLRIEGTVQLPTAAGPLTALKFSMDEAVADDVLLRSPGPRGRTMRLTADRMALEGHVALYATRFVGRLSGATITLGPGLPFPDGIPTSAPGPVTFTEPAVELVYLRTDTLTAHPRLKLSLARS
ncbi:hypothetical protein ACTMS0_25920 [Micromonospora sp. H33]|uniref:hypothetical protein n=1 Tax=Micromonospora sp. H33 TaxID=3452215 RepID=UPI003F8B8207